MNVLSLCDGMSCGQIALKELGIDVENYYSAEIDKSAIKVTQDNFPNTIQLGDVRNIGEDMLRTMPHIDLVMFGSPCRSLSQATYGHKGYNDGLRGVSGLFYDCHRILEWIQRNNNKDVKFLVENVNSSKETDIATISNLLGVSQTILDSSQFSPQERIRLYWTNIRIDKCTETNKLLLKDILDTDVDEKYYYTEPFVITDPNKRIMGKLQIKCYDSAKRIYNVNFKSPTLVSCRGGFHQIKILDGKRARKLTPNEYMKLQGIPSWYRMDVSNVHIYNMCGDGWNIPTIMFMLKNVLQPNYVSKMKMFLG